MRNETGRFDEDDLNKWKKPKDEPDPLSKILLRSSENVQLGAIFGFFVAAVLGAGMGFLAYNFDRAWVCPAVSAPFLGIIFGAIAGKILDVHRAMRRQARRAKKEQKEQKEKRRQAIY